MAKHAVPPVGMTVVPGIRRDSGGNAGCAGEMAEGEKSGGKPPHSKNERRPGVTGTPLLKLLDVIET